MPKTVAILGRPNVGKSTLFNRLAGKRLALVHDTPGVTRDWKVAPVVFGSLKFDLVDTAGLDEGGKKTLGGRMKKLTEQVLAEKADIALLVIDARDGVTPADEEIAGWIRPFRKPVIVIANKCEGKAGEAGYYEAFKLGFGEPVALSAEHGEGHGELIAELSRLIPGEQAPNGEEETLTPLKLAIVGRPNSGKSTLINRLLGSERVLTGPEAGITRDSIALKWQWRDLPVMLYDTAGLRKKAKVKEKLEKLSVSDTLRAIDFAECVVLLLEPELPVSHQDMRIARKTLEEGRTLVIAFNKTDLIKDRDEFRKKAKTFIEEQFPRARGVPVVFLSALKGTGMKRLMPAVLKVYEAWNKRIPTSRLNFWLEGVLAQHPLPLVKGRKLKIRYMTQAKTRPPTFMLSVNRPGEVPDSYLRYLENELRRVFDFPGVPLRFQLKTGKNPYAKSKKGKKDRG